MLATVDGQPVKHFTQWGELAPHSQQQLQALEAKIVAAREDSKTLDGVSRLQGEGVWGGAGGGAARRRELERAAKAASDALKLLETQLWSDNERLGGLREAVVATLRDAEHARARLTRLREAEDAEAAGVAHARTHPGHPPPPEATPVYLPPPRRPSAFLKGAVARLYAAAESFERGTLEMERNVRATGRVHGHGGAGPGLEALAAALRGGNGSGDWQETGSLEAGLSRDGGDEFGGAAFDASGAGPAELRAAVEGAQRYFNKVGGDLARLHEKVRRAKAEHLAALRRRGEHRDPFAEAEAAEAEYARLSAMAERPGFASAPPAGLPGSNAPAPAALPAPGGQTQTPGLPGAQTPGATPSGGGLFGGGMGGLGGAATPASTPALFGAAPAASTAGGLFGAASSPAPGGGGLFGAASSPAPGGGGLFGAASSPAPGGGGLFGAASSPAPGGGGLFGAASSPAPGGGGLFGAASSPAPGGGGLFGAASSPAPGGGGLFGGGAASAPAFGSPTPAAGGLFGAAATPGAFGAPATQQPRRARRR
jgi:nuclear pore complex protein Nup98-Nup96